MSAYRFPFLETEADDEDTLSMEKGKLLRRQSWREISASTNKKQRESESETRITTATQASKDKKGGMQPI